MPQYLPHHHFRPLAVEKSTLIGLDYSSRDKTLPRVMRPLNIRISWHQKPEGNIIYYQLPPNAACCHCFCLFASRTRELV